MKRIIAIAALAAAGSLAPATLASADSTVGPDVVEFTATCTGIGDVILANVGPAHTEARTGSAC